MIICPECGMATKAGHRVENIDGKDVKIRFCKKCNASLEQKATKAVKKATKKSTTAKKATKKAADTATADKAE